MKCASLILDIIVGCDILARIIPVNDFCKLQKFTFVYADICSANTVHCQHIFKHLAVCNFKVLALSHNHAESSDMLRAVIGNGIRSIRPQIQRTLGDFNIAILFDDEFYPVKIAVFVFKLLCLEAHIGCAYVSTIHLRVAAKRKVIFGVLRVGYFHIVAFGNVIGAAIYSGNGFTLDRYCYGTNRVDGQSAECILRLIVLGNIIAVCVFDDELVHIAELAGIRGCACIGALGTVAHAGECVTIKQTTLFNAGKFDFLAGVSTGGALAGEDYLANGYFKAAVFVFNFVVSLNFIACRGDYISADIFTVSSGDCVNNSLIVARAGYICSKCRRIIVSVNLCIILCGYGYVLIVVERDHVL